MRKAYLSTATMLACIMAANAQSKLDAPGQIAIDQFRLAELYPGDKLISLPDLPFDMETLSRGDAEATVFITIADGFDADDIASQGFSIIDRAGNMVIASGTLSDIAAISETEYVTDVSFGGKSEIKLDKARIAIGADEIHKNTSGSLPRAYTGAGVVTGIYDTGLDPNHISFIGNNSGNSRVKRVWHMTGDNGNAVLYDTPEKIATFSTDDATSSHGTHVLGCMAGSFNGNGGKTATMSDNGIVQVSVVKGNPYYGISTGSDIAIGCGNLKNANIMKSVSNINEYAKSQGKPAVINLSVGTSIGPHDGSDAVSRYLANIGKEAIICFASGNEGELPLSIVKTFSTSDKSVKTFISHTSSASGIIDIWGNDSDPFTVTPVIYNISTGQIEYSYPVSGVKTTSYITTSNYTSPVYIHDDAFDKAFSNSSLLFYSTKNANTNNRYEFYFQYQLNYNTRTNLSHNLVLGLMIEGKAGQRIELTNSSADATLSGKNISGWTDGNADMSINSMACSESTLVVGAWNTRTTWPAIGRYYYQYEDLTGLTPNEIAGYSSYGTTFDGRSYPHVCAPGTGIIATYSTPFVDRYFSTTDDVCAMYTANGRNHYWFCEQGTSMACPIVAGSVALWLEADPTLTISEVIDIAKRTATTDTYTGTTGNPTKWGAGKFNALAGLKEVLRMGSVNSVLADAGSKVMITPVSDRRWEIFSHGSTAIEARLYNISGQLVATVRSSGDTATIDAGDVDKGVYILNVNGTESQRILVK